MLVQHGHRQRKIVTHGKYLTRDNIVVDQPKNHTASNNKQIHNHGSHFKALVDNQEDEEILEEKNSEPTNLD